MATNPSDLDALVRKLLCTINKPISVPDNASLPDNDERNGDHVREEAVEWSSIAHYYYYMQLFSDVETLVAESKMNIANNLMKDSKGSIVFLAQYIMDIAKSSWKSSDAINESTSKLKRFVNTVMQTMIQPSNYAESIPSYILWQNEAVKYFVEQFWPEFSQNYQDKQELHQIEQAWNCTERRHDPMFFGGAARPLFSEKIISFSDLLSSYYNRNDPVYTQHRNILFNVLSRLLQEEAQKYWKNYEIFPSTTSVGVVEKCLHYFYFRDRNNTFFINSSGSDYIPFVRLAQQVFPSQKFVGSPMTDPVDHNTEWILNKLTEQCANILNEVNQSQSLIIILLTSKNRFGARIDVDHIHQKLQGKFPGQIVTLVDACQDAQSFESVDIILYSKRFTTTGAITLLNKRLVKEHETLRQNMKLITSFPINILSQLYANMNSINTNYSFGVEDLVSSANWHNYSSSVMKELRSVFGAYTQQENSSSSMKIQGTNDVQFEFTEDERGTIVIIRLLNRTNEDKSLSHLMSKLKEQGHTLDSFLMNDPLVESQNAIRTKEVEELIENRDLSQLRALEDRCSAYLAWPLVPFAVQKSSDDAFNEEHFKLCQSYHRCLRIFIDSSGYPGKLKRFVDLVQQIAERDTVTESIVGAGQFKKYSSQWSS